MSIEDDKAQYKKNLKFIISETTEKLALLQYQNQIKGCCIIVIDNDNVFRLMEAYGSDTLFAMNAGIDFAKARAINAMSKNLTDGKELE